MVLPSRHDLLATFNRKKMKVVTTKKKKKHKPPLLMQPSAAAAAMKSSAATNTLDVEKIIDPIVSRSSSKRVVTTKSTLSNNTNDSSVTKKQHEPQTKTSAAAAVSRDGINLNSNKHPLASSRSSSSSSSRVITTKNSNNLNSKNPMVDRGLLLSKRTTKKEQPVMLTTATSTRNGDNGIKRNDKNGCRCVTPVLCCSSDDDAIAATATNNKSSTTASRNGTKVNIRNDPLVSTVHRSKVAKKEQELHVPTTMIQTTASATRDDDDDGAKRDGKDEERRCVTPVLCSSDDAIRTTTATTTNSKSAGSSRGYRISVGRYGHEKSEGQSTSTTTTTWTMRDFVDCNGYLGSGKFGEVDLYHLRDNSKMKVALKCVNRKQCDRDRWCLIEREIYIQTRLSHDHICRCLGYFTTRSSIQVVLEYAPLGDLNFATRSHRISHKLVIRQVASALVYLHERNVAHRDVKMENVLVFSNNCVKLADFGWSIHLGSESHFRSTLCGTPACLPPEMLLHASYNALLVDSWALGILAHELVLDKSVFVGKDRDEILEKVKQFRQLHHYAPMNRGINNAPPTLLHDLLSHLICHAGNRWTVRQALQHGWLSNKRQQSATTTSTQRRRRRRRW